MNERDERDEWMSEQKWDATKSNGLKWNKKKWNEIVKNEMTWNEMKRNEIKWMKIIHIEWNVKWMNSNENEHENEITWNEM